MAVPVEGVRSRYGLGRLVGMNAPGMSRVRGVLVPRRTRVARYVSVARDRVPTTFIGSRQGVRESGCSVGSGTMGA